MWSSRVNLCNRVDLRIACHHGTGSIFGKPLHSGEAGQTLSAFKGRFKKGRCPFIVSSTTHSIILLRH
jgi:hypothetical protein